MVDKIDTILVIVALILIIVWFTYLLLCYRWNWYPYTRYERIPPDEENTVMAARRGEEYTAEEIEQRKDYAAEFCTRMANTENFMTKYCDITSEFGLIDCSLMS